MRPPDQRDPREGIERLPYREVTDALMEIPP
jgi:hypothetical protein